MKSSIPVVFFNEVRDTGILVGSDEWLGWLNARPSFRYECVEGSFTARRQGDYWNAYRKRFGRLRQEYLGKTHDMTCNRLVEIARLLEVSDLCYWQMRGERKKERAKGYREHTSITPNVEPMSYREESSITNPHPSGKSGEEILELRSHLTQMETKIRKAVEVLTDTTCLYSDEVDAIKARVSQALYLLR